jgi:hypothetical protein
LSDFWINSNAGSIDERHLSAPTGSLLSHRPVFLNYNLQNQSLMSSFIEKLRRLERLDALIRRRGTGRPIDLARRLEISESCLYKYLNYLKELGAEIDYCTYRQSYMYAVEFKINIGAEHQLQVRGGQAYFQEDASLFNLRIEQRWTYASNIYNRRLRV